MKNTLLFVLILAMCLSVCACGKNGGSAKNDDVEVESYADSSSEYASESESETEHEAENVIYQFGDSITSPSGMFVFTPSADGFTKSLGNTMDETYLLPEDKAESNNPYAAEEGKTMMYF